MPFAAAAFVVLGLVFLAREAQATAWLRRAIKRRAVFGQPVTEDSKVIVPSSNPISRFLDAMLDCAPCVSAWMAPPAIGLVYLVNALDTIPAALCIVFVVGPLASVGLLYGLTLLSPAQSMAMLVNAASRSKKRAEEKKDAPQ